MERPALTNPPMVFSFLPYQSAASLIPPLIVSHHEPESELESDDWLELPDVYPKYGIASPQLIFSLLRHRLGCAPHEATTSIAINPRRYSDRAGLGPRNGRTCPARNPTQPTLPTSGRLAACCSVRAIQYCLRHVVRRVCLCATRRRGYLICIVKIYPQHRAARSLGVVLREHLLLGRASELSNKLIEGRRIEWQGPLIAGLRR